MWALTLDRWNLNPLGRLHNLYIPYISLLKIDVTFFFFKGPWGWKEQLKGRAELSELRSWENDNVMNEAENDNVMTKALRGTKANHVLHEFI